MRIILRAYLSHWTIWFYFAMAMGYLLISEFLSAGVLETHWWILLLSIPMAPFFEWFAHKYLLHIAADPVKSPRAYAYMKKLHYQHHWDPNNLQLVFAPVSAVLIMNLMLLPMGILLFRDPAKLSVFLSGSMFYFLYYEWCHLAHHVPTYRPITAYGKYIKLAHTWHHYKNENFYWGVTNPIGDWVLGTFPKPEDVERSPNARGLGLMPKN